MSNFGDVLIWIGAGCAFLAGIGTLVTGKLQGLDMQGLPTLTGPMAYVAGVLELLAGAFFLLSSFVQIPPLVFAITVGGIVVAILLLVFLFGTKAE